MSRLLVLVGALAALGIFTPRGARAQDASFVAAPVSAAGALTLEEVVRSTLDHHPLLAAAEQDRAVAAADVLSAEGGFDPSLRARATTIPLGPYPSDRVETLAELPTSVWGTRLFAGYRVSRGSFAVYDGKMVTGDFGEARVGAQIPLWRDGPIDRRRAGLQRAELGTDLARLGVEQQRLEAVRSGSHRYWEWVAAGAKVAVARDILAIATTRNAGLALRVDRGDLPAVELAENGRVIHQRTAQLAAAERLLQKAAIDLSLFLRDESGVPVRPDRARLPQEFPTADIRVPSDTGLAERQALSRRPELRRIGLLAQQTRIDRDLANNQRKLGLDFYVSGAKDFGPAPDTRILKPELELALLLDVPLFTRVQDGRFNAAQAKLAGLDFQTRFARDRLVADVRDASSAVSMAEERIVAVRREIDASRQVLAMERQRFELGEGTLLLVNLREQALAEARQREVDALADYFKAVASQRAAVAAPLRSGR